MYQAGLAAVRGQSLFSRANGQLGVLVSPASITRCFVGVKTVRMYVVSCLGRKAAHLSAVLHSLEPQRGLRAVTFSQPMIMLSFMINCAWAAVVQLVLGLRQATPTCGSRPSCD